MRIDLGIVAGKQHGCRVVLANDRRSIDARADPARPVPVIMIGFGPDTDLAAMSRIAEATGGGAYSATRPEDLGTVLVDALSQRTCRPDCG